MLVRFFRSHQPILLVFIPLFAGCIWIPSFLHPVVTVVGGLQNQMPLFLLFAKPLCAYPFLSVLLAFLILLLQAFQFNALLGKFELIGGQSYFPALLYVCFCSFLPSVRTLHPALLSAVFVLLALNCVLGTHRISNASPACFEAGLSMALASLIFFPMVLGLVFVLIAVAILRPFSARDLIVVFLGFLLPWIYVFVFYFYFDHLADFWTTAIALPVLHRSSTFSFQMALPYLELLFFTLVAVFFSFVVGTDKSSRSVQYRSTITVLRWMFVFGVLVLFVSPGYNYTYFFMGLIPVLVLISDYFLTAKVVWMAELVMWLLVGVLIFNNQ